MGTIAKALPFMYKTVFIIATLYLQRIWRVCENKVLLKAFISLTFHFNSYPHQINSSNSFNAVCSVGKWKTFVCLSGPFHKHKKCLLIPIMCTFWHQINADWKVASLVDQILRWLKQNSNSSLKPFIFITNSVKVCFTITVRGTFVLTSYE